MVGPVLYMEMLLGSRRGRQYLFRWIYAGWLIAQFLFLYLIYRAGTGLTSDRNATAEFASHFVQIFVVQQLILLLLATPAFAAGAITDEKTRGTLQHMLTADLTAWEIVVGKLIGRSAQVAILALVGLPVLCFVGVFGGLHPVMLLTVMAITVTPLLSLSAASLLASVWSKQTRDAVLGLYAVGALGFLLVWGSGELAVYLGKATRAGAAPGLAAEVFAYLDSLLRYFNPLYVLEPAVEESQVGNLFHRLFASVLAWGSIGVVCFALAVWRLRRAYLRQLEGEGKKKKVHWWTARRMAVAEEPIRWKERHVEGIAPLVALRRVPRWIGIVLIFSVTTFVLVSILWANRPPGLSLEKLYQLVMTFDLRGMNELAGKGTASGEDFFVLGVLVLLIASLVVGIRCSGSVSGERERQTWEALLLTPLETRSLIRGKLWGIIGASVPYLLAYAVPAITLAPLGGFLAILWVLLWLAVTVLAMYFVGAAGMWCSVRSKTSWRSLLATLGIGYVGGFLIYLLTSPVILIVCIIIYLLLLLLDNAYGTASTRVVGGFANFFNTFFISTCVVLAGAFAIVSWALLNYAEKWVADRERIRHWKDEPLTLPRRRAVTPQRRYYR